MLQRVRELAVQYKQGTFSAADRAVIQGEVDGIASEIERAARVATYNGISLLSANGSIDFQVGADDGHVIPLATISLGAALGTACSALGGAADPAETDAAIDPGPAQRGLLGAVQNRLEGALQNVSLTQSNTVAAESRIRDVDMADEAVKMAAGQILSQSGTAMLA